MMKDFFLALSAVNHFEIINDKYPVKLQSCGLKHMHDKGFFQHGKHHWLLSLRVEAEIIIRAA